MKENNGYCHYCNKKRGNDADWCPTNSKGYFGLSVLILTIVIWGIILLK